jgi:hypothetical protein
LCGKIWAHFPLPEKHLVMCIVLIVSAEQDVMSAFENNFDIALVKLVVDETNRYSQQKISKCQPFHISL